MDTNLSPASLISDKIELLHGELQEWMPGIHRIAVAMYDNDTDVLRSFAHSTDGDTPIQRYEALLSSMESLRALADSRESRTIDDLGVFEGNGREHSRKVYREGFRSSFTIPILQNDAFHGFVFFNSRELGYFTDQVQHKISVYAQLIGILSISEIASIRTLQAAVKTAREFTRHRDEETGAHLIRMAHFSRLIAKEIGPRHSLNDEYIEFLYHFAPLHDIGKIAIPDSVLLKEGPLTDAEREVMNTHVTKGSEIIDSMITGFRVESISNVSMLRNIVLYHHERPDGKGYPGQLKGDAVPLEARIVSVADVFDALTSERPYKSAWSNAQAFDLLVKESGKQFDPECVAALQKNTAKIVEIQARFQEDALG